MIHIVYTGTGAGGVGSIGGAGGVGFGGPAGLYPGGGKSFLKFKAKRGKSTKKMLNICMFAGYGAASKAAKYGEYCHGFACLFIYCSTNHSYYLYMIFKWLSILFICFYLCYLDRSSRRRTS